MLDRAALIVEAGLNAQKQFAQDVLSGLTKEERHMCIKVFDKICNNAEEHLREIRGVCLIMRENNYKPQIPDMMEAIFDAAYLIFA